MQSEENAAKETIQELFGRNLKKYRKQAGLTQEELSKKLDVTQKHLSILETGTQFASAPLIQKICEELKLSPGDLFGGTSDEVIKHLNAMENRIMTMMLNELRHGFARIDSEISELKRSADSKAKDPADFFM